MVRQLSQGVCTLMPADPGASNKTSQFPEPGCCHPAAAMVPVAVSRAQTAQYKRTMRGDAACVLDARCRAREALFKYTHICATCSSNNSDP